MALIETKVIEITTEEKQALNAIISDVITLIKADI
jgi:hypothetical protein